MRFVCTRCIKRYPDESSAIKETNRTSKWFGKYVCPDCYDGPDPKPVKLGPDDMKPAKGF